MKVYVNFDELELANIKDEKFQRICENMYGANPINVPVDKEGS